MISDPIGLHTVHILDLAGTRVHVRNRGPRRNPILDVKPPDPTTRDDLVEPNHP